MNKAHQILLVEDNADDELLTIEALKNNHLANDIIVARDGQQALDYLFAEGDHSVRDISQQPQIILLDLNLPKISGLDVLRRIRQHEHTRYIPTIILTSSSMEMDMIESYDLGANSYLCKPIDFDSFSEVIKQIGLYWLILNRIPNA